MVIIWNTSSKKCILWARDILKIHWLWEKKSGFVHIRLQTTFLQHAVEQFPWVIFVPIPLPLYFSPEKDRMNFNIPVPFISR